MLRTNHQSKHESIGMRKSTVATWNSFVGVSWMLATPHHNSQGLTFFIVVLWCPHTVPLPSKQPMNNLWNNLWNKYGTNYGTNPWYKSFCMATLHATRSVNKITMFCLCWKNAWHAKSPYKMICTIGLFHRLYHNCSIDCSMSRFISCQLEEWGVAIYFKKLKTICRRELNAYNKPPPGAWIPWSLAVYFGALKLIHRRELNA